MAAVAAARTAIIDRKRSLRMVCQVGPAAANDAGSHALLFAGSQCLTLAPVRYYVREPSMSGRRRICFTFLGLVHPPGAARRPARPAGLGRRLRNSASAAASELWPSTTGFVWRRRRREEGTDGSVDLKARPPPECLSRWCAACRSRRVYSPATVARVPAHAPKLGRRRVGAPVRAASRESGLAPASAPARPPRRPLMRRFFEAHVPDGLVDGASPSSSKRPMWRLAVRSYVAPAISCCRCQHTPQNRDDVVRAPSATVVGLALRQRSARAPLSSSSSSLSSSESSLRRARLRRSASSSRQAVAAARRVAQARRRTPPTMGGRHVVELAGRAAAPLLLKSQMESSESRRRYRHEMDLRARAPRESRANDAAGRARNAERKTGFTGTERPESQKTLPARRACASCHSHGTP